MLSDKLERSWGGESVDHKQKKDLQKKTERAVILYAGIVNYLYLTNHKN